MRYADTTTESLQAIYAPIRDDLGSVEQIFDAQIVGDLPFINDLCEMVRVYRGKMLRPALVLLSARATGELTPAHRTLAAAIEMVHMATLVHDDVLDEADERRRQPTINRVSGNVAAVLLGDYLISHAYHLSSSLGNRHVSLRLGATTNTICEGELLQNDVRGRFELSESEYFDIIRRKTAALTAIACELGAYCAGAEPAVVDAMRSYGACVGIAFQIIDDLLDVLGDSATVGKTLGRDAALGKLTLPTIHCLAHADAETSSTVCEMLERANPWENDRLRECLMRTGSTEYALGVARRHVSQAVERLAVLAPSDAKVSLEAASDFIVERHF